jgi:hypothetical protein
MPDGRHRQYTSIQECKSVITTPSGGQNLIEKGYFTISGLAWSGRGKVTGVDVSVDGGINWQTARLEGPIQNKARRRRATKSHLPSRRSSSSRVAAGSCSMRSEPEGLEERHQTQLAREELQAKQRRMDTLTR